MNRFVKLLLLGISFIFLIRVLYLVSTVNNSGNEVSESNPVKSSSKLYQVGFEELMAGPIAQDDARILSYIEMKKFIVPPSEEEYDLKSPEIDPSKGQSTVVKKIFKDMRGGFFVECGALDGETRSNTLNLEKEFGWQGLLVEADPSNFEILLTKRRKAWAANVCLSTKAVPHQVMFRQHFNFGKIFGDVDMNAIAMGKVPQDRKGFARVQCFPIFTLLASLNIHTVDYFSLDVEGNEFQVLENIPFDKVSIKVLSVEYLHGKLNESSLLENFMMTKGYRVVTKVNNRGGLANDLIFAHSSVVIEETIEPIRT